MYKLVVGSPAVLIIRFPSPNASGWKPWLDKAKKTGGFKDHFTWINY